MKTERVDGGSQERLVRLRRYTAASEVEDGGLWHIGENPTGFDGTLCGIADEGIGRGCEDPFEEKDGSLRQVTCGQCMAIVNFCTALRTKPNAPHEPPR